MGTQLPCSRKLKLPHPLRDQRADFVGREAQVHRLGEQPIDQRRQPPPPRLDLSSACGLATNTPSPGRVLSTPFALQLGVRPGDRVRVDHQLLGKLPHRGQPLPRPQPPGATASRICSMSCR